MSFRAAYSQFFFWNYATYISGCQILSMCRVPNLFTVRKALTCSEFPIIRYNLSTLISASWPTIYI